MSRRGWQIAFALACVVNVVVLYSPESGPSTIPYADKVVHVLVFAAVAYTGTMLRLPLRWTAILYGRIRCSLAATTGVWTSEDAVKLLLAGADVTMMASALFRHGPEYLTTVLEGVRTWLEEHEYTGVQQLRGSASQANIADPVAYARSNYMQMLVNYSSPYDWREIPGSVQT